jgi:hypothetical protein
MVQGQNRLDGSSKGSGMGAVLDFSISLLEFHSLELINRRINDENLT